MQINIRNPRTGRFSRGPATNSIKAFKDFGTEIVTKGKKILKKSEKKGSGTLINDYKYKFKKTKNSMELTFEFGGAKDYWKFIDQGVVGTGGASTSRTKSGEQSARGGTGVARGRGSKYKFKYDNPAGKLVEALEGWISSRSIPLKNKMTITQTAFAMGYSIKRRGLERTLFFTKPMDQMYKKMQNRVLKAYEKDFEKVVAKMDPVIAILKDKSEL
tara:strand:- start:7534 stop:8181 length:648 start_codon:yes stop_codon:yes gene_type:complete